MSPFFPFRALALATLLAVAACAATAQRGPGGGPGGSPGGGGFPGAGAPGGGMGGGSGAGSGSGQPSNRGNAAGRSDERNGGAGPRNAPALASPGRWWDDKKTVRALNLRPDQQKRMDDLFDAARPTLIQLYSNLKQEEGRLSSMSRADLADETKVYAGIDRVTQARAELQKADTRILQQIRRELDPGQVTALEHGAAAPR